LNENANAGIPGVVQIRKFAKIILFEISKLSCHTWEWDQEIQRMLTVTKNFINLGVWKKYQEDIIFKTNKRRPALFRNVFTLVKQHL